MDCHAGHANLLFHLPLENLVDSSSKARGHNNRAESGVRSCTDTFQSRKIKTNAAVDLPLMLSSSAH